MRWRRIAVAFVLLLALVPALTSPNVSSQGYVTITTQTTTQVTRTSVALYPATTRQYNLTMSSYVGTSGPVDFQLNACGYGAAVYRKFNGISDQHFHFEWTTKNSIPIDFYITAVFVDPSIVTCANRDSYFRTYPPLSHRNGAVGSVDWVAPKNAQFVAWLWNPSLEVVSGSWSIQRFVPTIGSSTSYATAATTMLTNVTYYLTLTTSGGTFPFDNFALLGAIVAVAVIASVLIAARRRKSSPAPGIREEPAPTVQTPTGVAVATQPMTRTEVIELQPIISTGYADLDRALEGGIPEKFSIVIVSPSFDERDLLLRKVVQSALSSGKLAILVSNDISRTEDMISRYGTGFFALSPQADKISFHGSNLLKIPSIENLSEASISMGITIRDVIAKEKATKPIMILDILSDLLLRYKAITTRRWLTDFVGKRKAEGFTIIATLNPLTTTKEETQTIIDFFDGVIEIFEKPLAERARRFLAIKKMYGKRYSESEVLMDKDKLF